MLFWSKTCVECHPFVIVTSGERTDLCTRILDVTEDEDTIHVLEIVILLGLWTPGRRKSHDGSLGEEERTERGGVPIGRCHVFWETRG